MTLILNEKITDNVYDSVWLATLILTYEEQVLKEGKRIAFKQAEIQDLAQKLCTKEVQPARISQWCNGDHPKCNNKYLRAVDSKRRLTKKGEFNNHSEHPELFLDRETHIFRVQGKEITYGELFDWYCLSYSLLEVNLNESNGKELTLTDDNFNNEYLNSELQEDEIKRILEHYLHNNGWKTQIAMGRSHGIDIDAYQGTKRWIIEVKGCGSRDAMRVNYFLAILGETLQRMSDPNAKYSIALPDIKQYRNLWNRLPRLAKDRTGITALFVNKHNQIEEFL